MSRSKRFADVDGGVVAVNKKKDVMNARRKNVKMLGKTSEYPRLDPPTF